MRQQGQSKDYGASIAISVCHHGDGCSRGGGGRAQPENGKGVGGSAGDREGWSEDSVWYQTPLHLTVNEIADLQLHRKASSSDPWARWRSKKSHHGIKRKRELLVLEVNHVQWPPGVRWEVLQHQTAVWVFSSVLHGRASQNKHVPEKAASWSQLALNPLWELPLTTAGTVTSSEMTPFSLGFFDWLLCSLRRWLNTNDHRFEWR